MKRLILLIIFILIFSSFINYHELNNIGIIDSIGIDYIDNNYVVLTNILVINEEDKLEIKTFTNKSTNLISALNNLHLLVNKNINYNNLSLLVLSSNLNSNNLNIIINNLKNTRDIRTNISTIYINKDQIYNLFNLKIKANNINNQIYINANESGSSNIVTFEEVLNNYLNNTNILIPYLNINNNLIIVEGYKLLNNNNYLNNQESLIYNYYLNKISSTYYKDTCFYLNIKSSNTKVNSKDNIVNISINNDVYIEENKCQKELSENKIIETYNNYLESNLIELYKKYRDIDLYNFKDLIKKNDYLYYKRNYKNLMKKTVLKINVKSKLLKVS